MKKILYSAVLLLSLSSCGIYTKYQPETKVPDKLFGDSVLEKSITEYQGGNLKDSVRNHSIKKDSILKETVLNDSASLGFMDWHDFFRDPLLQQYIDRGLNQNTDFLQAMQREE